MAYKITRVYTLPENADVTHYSEPAEYREWFEENWAGGGRHIRTETSISEDGRTLTKNVFFVDNAAFLAFSQEPKVVEVTAARNLYNASNNIAHSAAHSIVEDEE
jgi:hypothetical protein